MTENQRSADAPNTADAEKSPSAATGELDLLTTVSRLCRSANFVRGHLERTVLRDVHLTWTAYDILQLIVARRPIDTRTIAAVACVSKATVTITSNDFVQRGLVRRDFDPTDTRRVRLHPRPAAWQLVTEVRADLTRALAELVGQQTGRTGTDAIIATYDLSATR